MSGGAVGDIKTGRDTVAALLEATGGAGGGVCAGAIVEAGAWLCSTGSQGFTVRASEARRTAAVVGA